MPARLASRDARIVLGLTAVALLARVAFVLAIDRDSFGFADPAFYHYAASTLASGDGYLDLGGAPSARWPPGYPFFLAPFYAVFGSDALVGELVNAVLGAASVPLLFLLARRLFGRREALIAAAVLALFPGQILYADLLLAETLYGFWLLLFFLLLSAVPPERRWPALAVGAAIGVLALTRSEGVFLAIPALAVWWPQLARPVLLRRAALLAAGMALVIGSWTVRNAIQLDAFIPIAHNGGQTLWSGHNPGATGGPTYPTHGYLPQTDDPESPEAAQEIDRFLRNEALEFIVEHPRRELELIPLKLIHLNRGDGAIVQPWLNNVAAGDERPVRGNAYVVLTTILDAAYYVLLALTLIAVVLFRRAMWAQPVLRGVLVLGIVAMVLYGLVFFGNPRYRAPLEPLMIMLAAPLLAALPELPGRRPAR
ncbi:MAG TPA: glycosyltransferase family 39 protein [Thermoleophilaceae bacterium]|nr:glycosyltransferase family 39 protein [Thermoleophilaceae bacterium]